MSNPIQNVNNIGPMKEQESGQAIDPVKADYVKGKSLLERGEAALAAVELHNALLGYEEKNDENGIANASNQLGHACYMREDYEKARDHYHRAEDICRKLGDPLSLLALSKQLADVYGKLGEVKVAIDRYLDILDLYQANNNPKGSVEILEKMAEIYVDAGDHAKAADTYKTIASIHKNFKHTTTAESYLEKAKEIEGHG